MRYERGIGWFSAAVVALLLAPSLALADPVFTVGVGCETGTGMTGSLPVSVSKTCGLPAFGAFAADAQASFGSLGAGTSAITFRGDAAGNAQASAQLQMRAAPSTAALPTACVRGDLLHLV